jgi:Fe-S oxidoreductase
MRLRASRASAIVQSGYCCVHGVSQCHGPRHHRVALRTGDRSPSGIKVQRLGHKAREVRAGLIDRQTKRIRRPRSADRLITRAGHPFPEQAATGKAVPTAHVARAAGHRRRQAVIPVIRDPLRAAEESEAVFYFPGCGSERLFSQVGLATQAMLMHVGSQCVLPPGYLCCGYPQTASGDAQRGTEITTANRVLFHRVANTLNYLDIKTVVVSCGTCMDQLLKYQFEQIFPGCRLLDIHEYLLEKDVRMQGVSGVRYLYHDPCHTPMKTHAPLKVASQLTGQNVPLADRCCGESGTFAATRPDIATQARFRKEEVLRQDAARLRTDGFDGPVKVLTSCPSCLQGLSRYDADSGTQADYIVVEIARHVLGDNWQDDYVRKANAGGIERVLL